MLCYYQNCTPGCCDVKYIIEYVVFSPNIMWISSTKELFWNYKSDEVAIKESMKRIIKSYSFSSLLHHDFPPSPPLPAGGHAHSLYAPCTLPLPPSPPRAPCTPSICLAHAPCMLWKEKFKFSPCKKSMFQKDWYSSERPNWTRVTRLKPLCNTMWHV